jgi:hypothetical protein
MTFTLTAVNWILPPVLGTRSAHFAYGCTKRKKITGSCLLNGGKRVNNNASSGQVIIELTKFFKIFATRFVFRLAVFSVLQKLLENSTETILLRINLKQVMYSSLHQIGFVLLLSLPTLCNSIFLTSVKKSASFFIRWR